MLLHAMYKMELANNWILLYIYIKLHYSKEEEKCKDISILAGMLTSG